MDFLVLMAFGISAGCIAGVAFLINIIIKEEREKKEKAEFARAFSKRFDRTRSCPYCKHFPCRCDS